jgi:hypothetical protein
METEKNISGISENLAESIAEEKVIAKKYIQKGKLHGKRIAISVSESEELEQLGLSEHHIKDISIEIARYLIVNGATMLYGGDLRFGGFTELFSELSYQYKYLSDKEKRFVNYFPFPNSKAVSENDLANIFKKQVEAKFIDIPKHLGAIDTEKKYEPFQSIEDRYILSECYADMRVKMANESNARIVLGGKQKNYAGYFPGIVEETFHSLKAGKAIYLLGGFGGATKSIIEIISGNKPHQLTNDFQFDSDFLKEFRLFASDKAQINLDYDFIFDFFKQHSIESISKQNGLTEDENLILFESTNIHELVFLIIKGLQKLK